MKLFTKYNRINLIVMIVVFIISGAVYYGIINLVLIHELDETLKEYKERLEVHVDKNGFGIASTKLAYLIYPHLKKLVLGKHISMKYSLAPMYQQIDSLSQQRGAGLSLN